MMKRKNKFTINYLELYNKYFKSENKLLILLCLFVLCAAVVQSFSPYIYGKLIDLVASGNIIRLKFNLITYLLILLFITLFGSLENYYGIIVTTRISNNIRRKFFYHIFSMKCECIDKYTIGELLSRFEGDISIIVNFYINVITSIFMIILNIIISLVFMYKTSIYLSLISMFFIAMPYIINLVFKNKLKILYDNLRRNVDKYTNYLNEALLNIKNIKIFQSEEYISSDFNKHLKNYYAVFKDQNKLNTIITILKDIINNFFSVLLLYISASLISFGKLTIGSLISFSSYLSKLNGAINALLTLDLGKQSLYVSLERIMSIEKEDIEINDGYIYNNQLDVMNFIIKDIKFSYGSDNILKNISFECNSAGLYSIVGRNGCGKSTLFKLFERLYEYDEGDIFINSISIKQMPINKLRYYFSYMQKEPFILNDTIINNIKMGNDTQFDLIVDICKKVRIHDYIISLKSQYNSILGVGGISLSSGQKQKLCLARVLLRNTPILLLDEVTSDLDGEAEKDIINIIKNLSKNIIIIAISHSTSLVMESDKIILLNDGKINQIGLYHELMNSNDNFKTLFYSKT